MRAYQANAVHRHALVREPRRHGEEVPRDVNGVVEAHGRVLTAIAQVPVLHPHLPHHGAQPLLA